MHPTSPHSRVLLAADWSIDAHAVVAAAAERAGRDGPAFGVVVPAWLHGLDWAGDPHASEPCAERQLAELTALLSAAGLRVDLAVVGDAGPATAIADALDAWPADEVLLLTRRPHFSSMPFDVVHRARRITRLPVERKFAPRAVANAGSQTATLTRRST